MHVDLYMHKKFMERHKTFRDFFWEKEMSVWWLGKFPFPFSTFLYGLNFNNEFVFFL